QPCPGSFLQNNYLAFALGNDGFPYFCPPSVNGSRHKIRSENLIVTCAHYTDLQYPRIGRSRIVPRPRSPVAHPFQGEAFRATALRRLCDGSQEGSMNRQQGFSLIELLIVVAIILIISGIAVPNLLKARISANESSAVGSIRALTSAAIQYFVQCPANGF